MIESNVHWIFFNVVIALLPLIFNIILIKIGRIEKSWLEIVKHGELFFFSTAITAPALGGLLLERPANPLVTSLTVYGLMCLLILSAGMFTLSCFLKLKNLELLDSKVFGVSSAWCALIAIILSYISFILVGGA